MIKLLETVQEWALVVIIMYIAIQLLLFLGPLMLAGFILCALSIIPILVFIVIIALLLKLVRALTKAIKK